MGKAQEPPTRQRTARAHVVKLLAMRRDTCRERGWRGRGRRVPVRHEGIAVAERRALDPPSARTCYLRRRGALLAARRSSSRAGATRVHRGGSDEADDDTGFVMREAGDEAGDEDEAQENDDYNPKIGLIFIKLLHYHNAQCRFSLTNI